MSPVAPLHPDDPAKLGRFLLTGRLGEGGQGVVFLGVDTAGGPVAVKALRETARDARARFRREVTAARRVASFCTAQIVDADVDGPLPYVVSEYVDGPSLAALIGTGGPLTGADLDRLAINTVTALAAIHEAGIVHRDFKPANVLMAEDGPRVVDFGIARNVDGTSAVTGTGAVIGTPAYLAPEQLTGAPLTAAVDLFAWGVTMVFAATGRSPFEASTLPQVFHRIATATADLTALDAPGVSPGLRTLVARCLDKDPSGRPAAHEVLLALLGHDASPHDPLSAALPPAPSPSGRSPSGAYEPSPHPYASQPRPAQPAAQPSAQPAIRPYDALPGSVAPASASPVPRSYEPSPGAPAKGPAGRAPGPAAVPGYGGQAAGRASDGGAWELRSPMQPAVEQPLPPAGPPPSGAGGAEETVAAGRGQGSRVPALVGSVVLFVLIVGGSAVAYALTRTATTSASTSASAQPIPAAFAGTWSGSVDQTRPTVTSWRTVLKLSSTGSSVSYQGNSCSGTVTVVSSGTGKLVLQQTLGSGSCPQAGYLTLSTSGSALRVDFSEYLNGSSPTATGRLTKQ